MLSKLELSRLIREAHVTGIGASEAAIVLGISRWSTELELWAEKRGLTDPPEDDERALRRDPRYWGKRLEPIVLQDCAMDTGLIVIGTGWDGELAMYRPDGSVAKAGRVPSPLWKAASLVPIPKRVPRDGLHLEPLRHPERPYMICLPDGVAVDEDGHILAIIEAKTGSVYKRDEWGGDGSDEVPDEYYVQAQHIIAVVEGITGHRYPVLMPVLLGNAYWSVHRITADDEVLALIYEREAEFWRRVEEDDPPPPGRDPRAYEALNKAFPREATEAPVDVSADEELVALVEDALEVEAQLKDLDKRSKSLKAEIKHHMGDLGVITCPPAGWKVTWLRTADSEKVDWQAVANDLALRLRAPDEVFEEIVARHRKARPGTRRFRIWGPKE